jgi:iron complex outermembrane recepter protein
MKTGTQRFRKTVVARALITAFCGTASMLIAQDTLAQQSSSTLQRVEVTGSNIRRSDTETASPVQVITKEEIDQSGKGTVAEYLQTLTADSQGSVPFTYGRGFAQASAAGISLRGLGANATLVLINGRRVTPSVLADDAQRTFVDLNQIPLEAVERVEVVKDGASAIYGSDAVAGVVNIILKKSFVGTVLKATYGVSGEGDGKEPRIAITHGMGDYDKDGWNLLLNAEFGKKDPIYYTDRQGWDHIGLGSIANFPGSPFDPNGTNNNNTGSASGRLGGSGWIPTVVDPVTHLVGPQANATSASLVGNVRGPDGAYHSRGQYFPAAQAYCNSHTTLTQNSPVGACLNDLWTENGIVQPRHETGNFFGRFSKNLGGGMEAFAELGYYRSDSTVQRPNASTASGFFRPNGDVVSRTALSLIGATHPDNPFPGTANRLSYQLNADPVIGADQVQSTSTATRALAGLKGTFMTWDFDTAAYYSSAEQTDTSLRKVNIKVLDALLNPTAANVAAATAASAAYAALPAGTFLRIGENAHLNSAALYNALLSDRTRDGESKMYGADIKVSREFGKLAGGPIGVAFGAEWRHEENNLPLYSGLGDYLGLSLTGYSGARRIWATYGELLLPVLKTVELNAALRYDNYSDSGTAVTPKVGIKWKALPTLALRGTYAEGFRAPSSTENSLTSIAAFGGAIVNDNARCAGTGVAATNCINISPTFVQRGNPSLEPEKSKSTTIGGVWDITSKASIALDWWQIKRTGLPVIEDTQAAIDAGHFSRDPTTATTPTDPGGILSAFVSFVNSSESLTRGVDLEAKHRWDLGNGMGRVSSSLTWTHLLVQRIIEANGTIHDYAGTHGNCDITNCMGSPRDRIQFATTWDMGRWRLGANVNYRGPITFNNEQGEECNSIGSTTLGIEVPSDCKLKAYTTLDLSGAWKFNDKTEVFGSVQNVFNKKPPFDYMTYGGIGYNPLDYAGAIGRFFRVGVKHRF